jgi:hypothetical protein
MKINNIFLLNIFLLMQCCFLFSHESSRDSSSKDNTPHIEMHVNHNTHLPNNWRFSANIITIPDYADARISIHYSILYQASSQLKNYFSNVVTPLMYHSAIADRYWALPGYVFPHGLRHCLHVLPQLIQSDAALIPSLTDRLETYCTRIESVLFKGDDRNFCETFSHKDQVALIHAYADFLKEFYPTIAQNLYDGFAQKNPLMQEVRPEINWKYYDGCNIESSVRDKDLRNAASVHSNLGVVYRALHDGDFEKACAVGRESVATVVSGRLFGKTTKTTSVFQRYPALQQKVEGANSAHQAKIEQERITKEKDVQQKAAAVQSECSDHILQKSHFDTLQKRYDAATRQTLNSQFFKKIHNIVPLQADYFDKEHLTSDQKGILCEGGYLQHHLVDEVITVVDVVASGDLITNMNDAVIDLANASLSLNRDGDVVMASRTLDACWALIDFAKDAAHYTYSALSTHVPLVAKGICDGACESLHGAVHAVCHLVEAAQDVVHSFVVAGYCLGKLAYADCVLDAATDLLETDPKSYAQMIQQYAIEPDTLVAIYEYAKKDNVTEDIARVGTKMAVDMMLLHGITKAVSAIAAESLPTFLNCMRKGGESAEVAVTAEGVPVRCADEVACLMEKMESISNDISKVNVVSELNAKKIWSNSKKFTELNKRVEILKDVTENTSVASLINTDTSIHKLSVIEKETSAFYSAMRETSSDIKKISANTGISRKIIERIKNHIFKEDHLLGDRIAKFDPDPDIAGAWNRLIKGNFVQTDLKLLQHEYAELLIMQRGHVGYDMAHSLVNNVYNWQSNLM